jgi:hypothetical protein
MNADVIILASASAIRPSTSLAAVYALLASARPRPLLLAFVLTGVAASTAIGIVVVSVLHGIPLPGDSERSEIVDVAAGAATMGFAVGAWSGQVRLMGRRGEADEPSRWARMLQRPSLKLAAAGGVATHLPGLFYLVALNSIAAGDPTFDAAVFEVLVYNAIWFSTPVAALFLADRHATATQARITELNAWVRRHQQALLVAVFAGVGTYLLAKGVIGLVS